MKNLVKIVVILVISILLSCSKQEEVNSIKLNFKLLNTFNIDDNDNIAHLTQNSVNNNNLYVSDYQMNKINIFDFRGNFLSQFGKKGNGPGEFQTLSGFFPGEKQIICYDENLRKFIFFDLEGNLLSQKKNSKSIFFRKGQIFDNTIYARTVGFESKDDCLYKVNTLSSYNTKLKNIDTLSFKKSEYNPKKYDISANLEDISRFALDSKTKRIAYTYCDDLAYKFSLKNLISRKETLIKKDINYKLYTSETYSKLKKLADHLEKSFKKRNREQKVKPFDKKGNVICDLAFDKDSNLWVSIRNSKKALMNFIIYDENLNERLKVKTNIPLKNDFYIKDGKFIVCDQQEILVYELLDKLEI